MSNDLPDYQVETKAATLEATSLRSGLDADKPASPLAGDIWLARDTFKLYFCMASGVWTGLDASELVQGVLTLYSNADANSKKITNLAAPTANADAARKLDVDTVQALLNDVSQAQPSRSIDTVYQNSTKIRLVIISVSCDPGDWVTLDTDSSNPPATTVAEVRNAGNADLIRGTLVAVIVPSNYYKLRTVLGTITIGKWTEWDLF